MLECYCENLFHIINKIFVNSKDTTEYISRVAAFVSFSVVIVVVLVEL